jgi:hypothetical protein
MIRFVCLIALGGSALGLQEDATPSEQEREKDVYRIYSLLMTNPRTSHGADNNPRYLIASATTRLEAAERPCVRPPKEREAEFQEVLADFELRKATPRTLERQLSIRKPYKLLTAEEVNAFQKERGWPKPDPQKSDPRFEGVTDLFTFYDVYFSKNGRLALTAVSSYCGGLCGLREWKVFEKLATGQWQERNWVTCSVIS